MFEFIYVLLIVVQFAIGPIIAFGELSTLVMWILFGVQVVAAVWQNIQFPCFTFRICAPALLGSTLGIMFIPSVLTAILT